MKYFSLEILSWSVMATGAGWARGMSMVGRLSNWSSMGIDVLQLEATPARAMLVCVRDPSDRYHELYRTCRTGSLSGLRV